MGYINRNRAARWSSPFAVLIVCAFLFWPMAGAAADVEPANETPVGAGGWLSQDVTYAGEMGAATDEADWYYFYAQPSVELTIKSSVTGCSDHNFDMELFGRDGNGGVDGRKVWAATIKYQTPPDGGPRLYYLRLKCHPGWKSPGAAYTFRITSPSEGALVPGEREFGPTQPVSEPNEFRAQAIGPLLGGVTYEGAINTRNDQDWFFFYAKPLQEIEVSATTADLFCSEDMDGFVWLEAESAEPYSESYAPLYVGAINRIRHTTVGTYERYYVSVGCPLSSYLFRITPAGALASQACVDALTARGRLAAQLTRLQRSRQNAKRSHARKVRRMTKQERRTRKPALKRRLARELKRTKRKNRHRLGRLARGVRQSREASSRQAAVAGQACA